MREPPREEELARLRSELERATRRATGAERALRDLEERYRMIALATNDVIWDWDLSTGEVVWNEAARRVFLYGSDEIGRTAEWWKQQIHPEDRPRVLASIYGVIDGGGEYWSGEYRFRRGNGTYAAVFDRGFVAHDENGVPVRMIGSMVDITERTEEADELRATEAHLRLALEAAQLGDWELDLRTHRSPRRSFRHDRIFGYTEPLEDWSYDRFLAHVHPEDRPEVDARFRVMLESGRAWDFECRIHRVDGALRWIWAKGGVLYDRDGRPTVALGIVADITERKRAEEELRRAKEKAEIASRAKTDFLAVMSHELRTPLTAVLGYVALLEDEITGPLNAKQKEQLARVRESGRHLLDLIEQILSLSRVESGRMRVQPEPFDAAVLVRDAAEMIAPLAARKGLAFSVDAPETPVPMTSDPGKVRQILLNLLSNAIKFTETGEVRLKLEPAPDAVVFEVSDTGPGIAPEDRDRIFQPFIQVERGRTRAKGGAGLGLAVSRELARLLGGSIAFASEPGRGTTFTLRVPRESSTTPHAGDGAASSPSASSPLSSD